MERPKFHSNTERRLHTVKDLRERFEVIIETNGSGLYKGKLDSTRSTDLFPDTVIHVGEKRKRDVLSIASSLLPMIELRYRDLLKERLLELKNAGHISEEEYDKALGVKNKEKSADDEVLLQEESLPKSTAVSGNLSGSSNGLRPQREARSSFNGVSPALASEIISRRNGKASVEAELSKLDIEGAFDSSSVCEAVRPARDPNVHAHHWIIEEPNGPTSEGVCSCGVHRQFKNFLPDFDFILNEEHRVAV